GISDGLPSEMEKHSVLVKGQRAFIHNYITDELMRIDVTSIHNLKIGDEVVIMGRQGDDSITVNEMCKRFGFSRNEMLSRINHSSISVKYMKKNNTFHVDDV